MPRTDEEYRALQEQVHLLHDLTQHAGWKELQAICLDLMAGQKRHILNGLAKTHEEYLKTTHAHVGMHKVLDIPRIAFETLENERKQRVEHEEPLT